jgi:hypothetical protein
MYIQNIQGLFQSRLGTADYALVTSSLLYHEWDEKSEMCFVKELLDCLACGRLQLHLSSGQRGYGPEGKFAQII